jgi:hypothetical protein
MDFFARLETWKMEIFEPKRDEVKRGLKKLHTQERHEFYSPSSITRVMKPGNIVWEGMQT